MQDAFYMFADYAPAHIHTISMLNSTENQLQKIDAKDHTPKNISFTKVENILKRNQSEACELLSTFQVKLNAGHACHEWLLKRQTKWLGG